MSGAAYDAESINSASNTILMHHLEPIIVELAGLFWLGAEAVILWFVQRAAQWLDSEPRHPVFTRADARRLSRVLFLYAAGCLLWVARYLFPMAWLPLGQAPRLPRPLPAPDTLYLVVEAQHLVFWGILVTAWVVVECVIVARGITVFRRLRHTLEQTP